MDKLAGMFFDLLSIHHHMLLKMAAIYFDKVYILSPVSIIYDSNQNDYYAESRKFLMDAYSDSITELTDMEIRKSESGILWLQNKLTPLIDHDIVSVVNPFDDIASMGLFSQFKDIIRYRFKSSAERCIYEKEYEESRRVPTLGAFPRLEHHDFPFPPNSTQELRVTRSEKSKHYLVMAEESAIRSILIDSAVILHKKYHAIPVACSDVSAQDFASQVSWHKSELSKRQIRNVQSFKIMRQAIIDNIPCFSGISFEDIIDIKKHCKDELESFRLELQKLATFIKQNTDRDIITEEIQDIVAREINPVVHDLTRKLKLSNRKWAKRLFDDSGLIKNVIGIVSTSLIGIPLYFGLLAASVMVGAKVAFDSYFESETITTGNAFSLLLRLRKIGTV